ncbi:MAG: hypothetical protein Q8N79_00755 [Candidatus Methanoperedens sp.]|nr:hypothetical protein [Candidatus Methanoperedens sp.]
MSPKTRTAPRYEMLFSDGEFNCTLLIGPDPLGADFDYRVFLEARRILRMIGFRMTGGKRGLEEYQRNFTYDNKNIKARIRLVLCRNYAGDLQEFWRESLAHEDFIYLKTHAGYGRHLCLSDDVRYFTDAMKEGFVLPGRKPYQLYYLDCCKSEMYYKDVFRNFVGSDGVDLILNKWFCDYKIIRPVMALIGELMEGSDFETIVLKMNEEYGIPHFDVEDDPADMTLDRKMVTYSVSER